MFGLAGVLIEREENTEAETWLRRAAEAGLTDAKNTLGELLSEREENTEAEPWYRRAAEAGHTSTT